MITISFNFGADWTRSPTDCTGEVSSLLSCRRTCDLAKKKRFKYKYHKLVLTRKANSQPIQGHIEYEYGVDEGLAKLGYAGRRKRVLQ